MKSLTDRQKQILDFVINSINDRGYPPSVRDICKYFDIQSPQGAQRHLNALEKKGYLKRDARLARSLSVTALSASMMPAAEKPEWIPVVGDVAAGAPILAQEDIVDQIPLSKDWLGIGKDYFFLRVKGDSMAEAIQPGDLVLVERAQTANRGEIVVALLEEEATCKRYFPDKNCVRLRSDNPRYDDIVVANEFKLLGKVKALVRKYQ